MYKLIKLLFFLVIFGFGLNACSSLKTNDGNMMRIDECPPNCLDETPVFDD